MQDITNNPPNILASTSIGMIYFMKNRKEYKLSIIPVKTVKKIKMTVLLIISIQRLNNEPGGRFIAWLR